MRPPASVAFQLITFRGASARGRRPSLHRSSWPGRGNRLSRSAATPAETRPSLGPSGEPTAPTGNVARKADPVTSPRFAETLRRSKADIGGMAEGACGTKWTTPTQNDNAPAPAGA